MKAALLFLIVLISSCTPTENVSRFKHIGTTKAGYIYEITIDNHDYITCGQGLSHSGTCRKCKQEKDSITSLIINTIKDGRTDNQR